jgi:hypothetical protein
VNSNHLIVAACWRMERAIEMLVESPEKILLTDMG